jgi:pimeloyl-ACP methyl ester carboxylesterase
MLSSFSGGVHSQDLLGYGNGAEDSSVKISLGEQVREVIGCVERAFGPETVDLVGHSVGGAIAMLVAAERPSMVRRVVNIEGNFTLNDAFWSASVGRITASEAESMLAALPAVWLNRAGVKITEREVRLAREWLGFQPALTLRQIGRSVVDVNLSPPEFPANRKKYREFAKFLATLYLRSALIHIMVLRVSIHLGYLLRGQHGSKFADGIGYIRHFSAAKAQDESLPRGLA